MAAASTATSPGPEATSEAPRLWVEHLTLTDFRNYPALSLDLSPGAIVLVGANGSGKTNILEAVSLLAPGQGLRQAPFADLTRTEGAGGWSVFARVNTALGAVDIGTGLAPEASRSTERTGRVAAERAGRIVRIEGEQRSGSGALADYVEMVWVTPATDGLFLGPASERRRFLDRLIVCFDSGHRTRTGHFERAMASRNRLLADGVRENARLEGLELVMAETGIAIAAARAEAVAALAAVIAQRRTRDLASPFPWSELALAGTIDADLARLPAVDVEDAYMKVLREMRERDRAAGRTLDGPHRSDLNVTHGPKNMPARLCSTGEQKALLLGLVLAHAELVKERQEGMAPALLLDEVTAHLDEARRHALFAELLRLECQSWMTGTDQQAFSALGGKAQFWRLDGGFATAL
jgi:DNA replication and repair protein RecF